MADGIGSEMTPEERYELITRNLQEVLGGEAIMQKLKNNEQISLYWGTATTGRRKYSNHEQMQFILHAEDPIN
jgi:hypothetical protein